MGVIMNQHRAMKFIQALFVALTLISVSSAREAAPATSISYYPAETKLDDPQHRCALDMRLPANKQGFATVIWFHGGGLTGGTRDFPMFAGEGVALISAGYRLSPQVPCPVFIEDAAAAVAWTLKNISRYGGDPKKVFVGGHSAGGYLALMVGMDAKWLKPYGLAPNDIAGLLPVSAQVTTHFHIKELQKVPGPSLVPVIDEFAPLHFASKDLPPICLITGDRRIEWPCRVEENELLFATLKKLEHRDVEFHEIKDLNHATIPSGAAGVMPGFVERISTAMDAK
jgi:acetyl esterase/lipase